MTKKKNAPGDKMPSPCPLTRGQVKALRAAGTNLSRLDRYESEQVDDAIDAVLDMAFGAGACDHLPNAEALELFRAVIEMTFGVPDTDRKNSRASGTGTDRTGPDDATGAASGQMDV